MELEEIKETFLYKHTLGRCFKHPELISDLVIELHIAYEANPVGFEWNDPLYDAFEWIDSPQGYGFWEDICYRVLPERYK